MNQNLYKWKQTGAAFAAGLLATPYILGPILKENIFSHDHIAEGGFVLITSAKPMAAQIGTTATLAIVNN